MSFNINSDKETFRGSKPAFIGDNELTIRGGVGASEKEILRTQLDADTSLPRVGINRTGQRVNTVTVTDGGAGYTVVPSVTIDPPSTPGGVQALASAFIFNGRVINIAVNNPGSGYTSAPNATITGGGGGAGATATVQLDTVDFELDINGAIRTSTSIISDTARILNLDIDNFITPDLNLRGPNFKTYVNNTGIPWADNVIIQKDSYRYFGANVYQALNTGQTGSDAPEHVDGVVLNGEVNFKHIGFRVIDEEAFGYNTTGDAGVFPRSITPLLGDRSDKIATTEYVLNLATNDVGGRIYVSQQIGSDENDGRSAVSPVRTIKKAAQLAWSTPGVKETLIVSGGDYVEDNPISLPPDCSVVGDNLRLVIIRPANPKKHIFKFGDKNYVIGVTYRDQVDAFGDSVATWDFAMVFDDKQRVIIDQDTNGDFGVNFPIGHQIFGPDQFRLTFQDNTGLSQLSSGLEIVGINSGARASIIDVSFTTTTGASAYLTGTIDVTLNSGSFIQGESFRYLISGSDGGSLLQTSSEIYASNTLKFSSNPESASFTGGVYVAIDDVPNTFFSGTQFYEIIEVNDNEDVENGIAATEWYVSFSPILGAPTFDTIGPCNFTINDANVVVEEIDTTDLISIRAEGEVVSVDEDITSTLPIHRIDFSLQGDPSIATGGVHSAQFGNSEDLGGVVFYTSELVGRTNFHDFKEGQEIEISGLPTAGPDLSALNGKQRIYKVIEDADGRARRFVIPKKFPSITDANFQPGSTAVVKSYAKSVTLTLLNSPNKFPLSSPVDRRYQDAVTFIRNNRDFIADEVVGKINDQFKKEYYSVYDIGGSVDSSFTPTNVTYDPATGDSVFTVANHGLSVGDGVKIADESITFTCTMDSNKTEHALPESDQYASGKALPITAADTNTFTLNVGASGGNQQWTPSGASYDPATGDLILTIGTHTLSVGEGIVIDDNSLSFTCDMDNNQSVKTYPRPGIDPYAGRSMPITAVGATTITVNAGVSQPNRYFQPSAVNYDPVSGLMTCQIGQHGLGVGRNVVLSDNSFTFTCDQDGNTTQHTYPRPGSDPYAGQSITIQDVGFTEHTPTDAPYNASTGTVTFTVANHGFSSGDYVQIQDGSLTYTCDLDGNTAQKTYPRAGYDYPSGRWMPIAVIDANTFSINVGSSSYTGAHTFVSASANAIRRQDGWMSINVGNAGTASGSVHTFVSATANAIKFEPQSPHTFTGATANAVKHLPQSAHTFVRSVASSLSVGGSEFKIYLGFTDQTHTYVSGGTVTYGGNTYNITNFVWDNIISGAATVTLASPIPGIAEDDTVQINNILLECDNGQKLYPSFSIPVDDDQCRQDVVHFLNALSRDLEFGSNFNVIEAAKKYIVGAKIGYVENEIIQTVRAIEYARELATFAMCNWRTGNRTPSDPIYTPVYSSLPRYFDDTVITTTAGTPACANVASAIDTLAYLWVDVLANNASGTYLDAAYLIARNKDLIADQAYLDTLVQYPALGLNNVDERKCRRDIGFILRGLVRDLCLGGNSGTVTNAEFYYTGAQLTGIDSAYLPQTLYAYQQVRDYAIAAMRNWTDGAGTAVTTSSPIPQFTDGTILADPGNPDCANVASTITTLFALLEDILDGTVAPGATTKNTGTLYDTSQILTYPDSFVYDQDGVRMAVRGDFDDFPIIEASPYTQNSSVISFLGGGGALIDGSKVKQPNCPFPGLELDGTASFPNQGKSMVAAAFTIVSFGGTGYKVINDGYTQLVSVFVIFCSDGVLCESGGYASITNSATNFGQYALRGTGFRKDPYVFDIATITNVSATPTGRTILTVSGLGREPLEHYVVKIDGIRNTNPDIEYFVDAVGSVTVGPPFSAQLTIDDGTGQAMDLTSIATGNPVSVGTLTGSTINLHRPSIVNSSSHTWEFAGSGINYLALPENGGTKVEAFEQVSEDYGRVYVSGTDELGDFKVGTFARIENRTGAITFTGTVTISEVEFLKLKGGDVVVTGFDASNTLGGANATDSKLPTQKAVRDYITNNLGPYINKPYSTNAVPRALVELTDSGKISIDQIPALRPFSVFTVADQTERLAIEGALAGDIAIQQDTSTSFILNNDNSSLFAAFPVDPTLQFTINDIFTGSISGGRIQATEYRTGVVYQINITDGGSGYTSPPTVTISGGNPGLGAIPAQAECTIANGEVVTVTIIEFQSIKGGKGYTTQPTVTFAAPTGSGTQAQGDAFIESRLYGNIVNNVKITDTDTIDSSDVPPVAVNISRVVNTSSSNANNWVSLSSNQIAASDITSGVLETDRLATGGAANSFTFLRGDQNFALAVQSVKGSETRYFAQLYSNVNAGSSSLIFTTNSDVLIGHEVLNNVSGIQLNTNITGVITAAGLTTVSINNPVTATIPAGTIIEFERGGSPMIFESSYTQGGFIDDVIISAGGSGFTNGQYFDVGLSGGTGTGLRCNIIVANNAVTEITVTDGGTGYNADFSITNPPPEIGGGSGLVLEAKLSTVNRQYANVSIDVQRVTDLTISSDLYGTIGVARFKKSQFTIGQSGNGSIDLNVGPDSGLDADLLDGAQGSFYLNSSNQNAGTLPTDRLSGTYNIDISGSSGNTLRVLTGTNNPTSNPTPNFFQEGIVANTVNNSSNQLLDGGNKHLVMTIRQFGSNFDASGGGVRQLAFTDNDNMWLRGSGTGVTSFGSWAKIWSSLNDGVGSGLNADRLDDKQGTWYQNALNINEGTLSDNRLPRFISPTVFRDDITLKSFNGDPKYQIYISGRTLTTSPFTPGNNVNLYNSNGQGTGQIAIDNIIVNDDPADNFNDYTIIVGRLTTGNFIGAVNIGSVAINVPFQEFTIEDDNTVEVAKWESDGGTANLRLGRKDGVQSSPGLYFNSSTQAANYNSAIIASGGNASDGSGTLNVQVVNADGFSVNGSKIWNEGNIEFQTANIGNTAVKRDASGNFSAGTITATISGSASLNVLKAGDTMTGSLTLTGAASNFQVQGTGTFLSTVSITNDLAVDTDTLFVDVSTDRVGINAGANPAAPLEVRGDGGIMVRSITNAPSTGAQVRFSDQTNGYSQQGTIRYNHADSQSPNSNYTESFTMEGTESELAFRVVGDIIASRKMGVNINREPNYTLEVNGTGFFQTSLTIDSDNDNSGAPLYFRGSSSARNFRIGNQIGFNDCFEITASSNNGGTSWKGTPALLIDGSENAIAVNTSAFSGVDPSNNQTRNYKLNVQGDMNINGQLFQNNSEFVTSRWTEASNQADIYRISRVGINRVDPTYQLHISGDTNIENGALYANGVRQWIDSYGIFKSNSNTVAENITIPANINCVSAGPITIANGYTVTINSGGNWAIV